MMDQFFYYDHGPGTTRILCVWDCLGSKERYGHIVAVLS